MKKKEKESITFLSSSFMFVGVIFTFSCGVGIGLFTLLFEPCRTQLDTISWCIVGFACGVLQIFLIIVSSRRGLSVVRIDESGIKRLIFGFIKSTEMKWDNIAEIRYYERGIPFIFVSKTLSLENKIYDYIIKQKDVLQIQLNKKVYNALMKYIQQPIIGLTEEKLTALKLK